MGRLRDEDVTQEVVLPPELRPSRNALTLHVIKGPRVGEVLTIERDQAVLGRGDDADVRIEDPSLSRMHVRFTREHGTLSITDLDSLNGTMVEGTRLEGTRKLKSGDLIALGAVLLRFAIQDATEVQVSRELFEAAVRDRLTGLYNRGYFEDRLAAEFAFVRRHQTNLAVLLIDLDHFKQVNDTHGHPVGDEVLKVAANTIRASLRAEDLAARYGGEEFVVLARGTEAGGAQVLGQRLRTRIAAHDIPAGHAIVKVTASVGIAVMRKDVTFGSPIELVAAADAALYEAKRNGRNQVVVDGRALAGERPHGAYTLKSAEERMRPKLKKPE